MNRRQAKKKFKKDCVDVNLLLHGTPMLIGFPYTDEPCIVKVTDGNDSCYYSWEGYNYFRNKASKLYKKPSLELF